jgi:hypothetical protein
VPDNADHAAIGEYATIFGAVSGTVLYDDGGLLLDEDGITIRRYYFPWAGSKRIAYGQLSHVEARPMGALSGQGRIWGTTDPRHWLPLDLERRHKQTLLVLDIGRRVRPAVSPDDPDRVLELLHERMAP